VTAQAFTPSSKLYIATKSATMLRRTTHSRSGAVAHAGLHGNSIVITLIYEI